MPFDSREHQLAGGSCGRPVCHSVSASEVCSRSVTGAVDPRRLAQRCALRRGYEVRESRQPESRRQLRCRRQLAVLVSPARGISGKFTFVHRYVRVNSWTWLHPRVFELVSATYNIFRKCDYLESLWLARNVQLRGVH